LHCSCPSFVCLSTSRLPYSFSIAGWTKKNNHKIGKIIITNLLNQRPKSSELRLELGHWEADTVIGKQGKACILTLVDRKSRKVLIKKLPSKDSISVKNEQAFISKVTHRENNVTINLDAVVEDFLNLYYYNSHNIEN